MCTTRAGRPIDMLGLVASSPATRDEAVPSADQKRPTCHESGRSQPTRTGIPVILSKRKGESDRSDGHPPHVRGREVRVLSLRALPAFGQRQPIRLNHGRPANRSQALAAWSVVRYC